MFYRFTRIHFENDRYSDLLNWADSIRDRVEAIEGFEFAELCQSGQGEGMIIAAYRSEADFDAAADVAADVMAGIAQFLTAEPHTHAGTSDRTFRRA
jgi:heme-degrading monooxygenase HmoA